MAWASSTGTVAAANAKVSSATFTTGLVTCPSGHTIFLVLAFDNLTATTPTVNSITVPGGETATWRRIGTIPSTTATAAAGVRGELYAITTTAAWTTFQPVVTFSAAITAKASAGVCKSGPARGPGARIDIPLTGVTSAASAPSQANTRPKSGDLVLGLGVCQTATPMTADADTTNGAWVTEATSGTTGGTDNTNVTLILQSKIPSADGTQTYNPTDTVSTNAGAICVELVPTSTVAQVGRVHAEALHKPQKPDAQVGRVHAEALHKPQKPSAQVGRVHVEVLTTQSVGGAPLARITETETVFPLAAINTTNLARITETDTAFALDVVTKILISRVTETDTAFPVTALSVGSGPTIEYADGTLLLSTARYADGSPLIVRGILNADGVTIDPLA